MTLKVKRNVGDDYGNDVDSDGTGLGSVCGGGGDGCWPVVVMVSMVVMAKAVTTTTTMTMMILIAAPPNGGANDRLYMYVTRNLI